MEVLGIVLISLTGMGLIIFYLIIGIGMQTWGHTFLMVYLNSKKTLNRIVKPYIMVKAYDMEYYWEKTDFGDFRTRWKLIDQSKRDYKTLELYFDKYGNITHLESDTWDNNQQILKDSCHDGLDLDSLVKNR